jgi:hypothetical protein
VQWLLRHEEMLFLKPKFGELCLRAQRASSIRQNLVRRRPAPLFKPYRLPRSASNIPAGYGYMEFAALTQNENDIERDSLCYPCHIEPSDIILKISPASMVAALDNPMFQFPMTFPVFGPVLTLPTPTTCRYHLSLD